MTGEKEITNNRKATHEYHILETVEAGLELRGTEVKSIRGGKINLRDAFARIDNGQCFLHGCDIQPYERASWDQHDAKRVRRLLLHKKEISRLYGLCQIKGNTLGAVRAYWKGRRVKVELGVGKGKVAADKRQDLKKKEANREMEREMQRFNRK